MKLKISVLFLILLVICKIILPAEADLFGYFENRFFLIDNTGFSWSDLNQKFQLGDYNRLRLKLKAAPADNVTLNVALDFFSFHGILTSPLGTYTGETTDTGNNFSLDLDRVYADINFKNFDISIGKQRVALGVSYLWAPLDIFNRVNLLEPKEEKPGINAFKIIVPFGANSSITGVFSPDDSFTSSRSGLRIKTMALGIDIALTLISDGILDTMVYGLDLRGENFIGWWLEAGYFVSDYSEDLKFVLGFDYTFPFGTGLYWLNEYYFDASGAAEPDQYDYSLLLAGNRFTLGRHYFFSMFRYGISDFLSASVTYIANWGDGSFIINPAASYDLFQNVSVTAGLYLPFGDDLSEFNGQDRNIFFIWLKINF